MVVEKLVVEGPMIEGMLFERPTNGKTTIEGPISIDMVHKKLKVD